MEILRMPTTEAPRQPESETANLAAWLDSRHEHDPAATAVATHLLCGAKIPEGLAPRTPESVGECLSLFSAIPSVESRFSEMASCGSDWAAVVGQWDRITGSYDQELMKGGKAEAFPVTQELLDVVHGATQLEQVGSMLGTLRRHVTGQPEQVEDNEPAAKAHKRFGLF